MVEASFLYFSGLSLRYTLITNQFLDVSVICLPPSHQILSIWLNLMGTFAPSLYTLPLLFVRHSSSSYLTLLAYFGGTKTKSPERMKGT